MRSITTTITATTIPTTRSAFRLGAAVAVGVAALVGAPRLAHADTATEVDGGWLARLWDDHTPAPRPVEPPADTGSAPDVATTTADLGDLAPAPRLLNPCGVAPAGATIELGGVRELDLDGGGADDDRAVVYFDGDWKLRVTTSSGVQSELWLADERNGPDRPAFRRPAEVDGDPDDEIKLETMRTAGASFHQFFGLDEDGCLFRFHADHGSPTSVMIRDVPGAKEHLDCYPGGLVVQVAALEQGDGSWEVSRRSLLPSGPQRATLGAPEITVVGHESQLPEPGWPC